MGRKILAFYIVLTLLSLSLISCSGGGGGNNIDKYKNKPSDNDVINPGNDKSFIDIREGKKSIFLTFSDEIKLEEVVIQLPDESMKIKTSEVKAVDFNESIEYLVILDKNGRLIGIIGTFIEDVEVNPENIAVFLTLINTPFIKFEKLSKESFQFLKDEMLKLNSFNELKNKIRNQLQDKLYLDDKELEESLAKSVEEFIQLLLQTDPSSKYNSLKRQNEIVLNPNEEYHFNIMIKWDQKSLKLTELKDKYGNQVYSLILNVYNKGILWQELLIIEPNKIISDVGGLVPPQRVSEFVGTFTSLDGLRSYFKDLLEFNFLNSTWDAKKTTMSIYVSCAYNHICLYSTRNSFIAQFIDSIFRIGSLLGDKKFNEFMKYIIKNPELSMQIYNLIISKRYSEAINVIKSEFIKWGAGKLNSFLMESVKSKINFVERNMLVLDVVQSYLSTLIESFNVSLDPKYCWKFENVPCGKKSMLFLELNVDPKILTLRRNEIKNLNVFLTTNAVNLNDLSCSYEFNGLIKTTNCNGVINIPISYEYEGTNTIRFTAKGISKDGNEIIRSESIQFIVEVVDKSQLVSGSVIWNSLPDNLSVRITPDVEMIEGSWGGIVCKVSKDGTFGDNCVLYGNESNYTPDHKFQIIVFLDRNGDFRLDKNESSYFALENAEYGAWERIEITLGDIAFLGNIELDSWQYIPDLVIVPNETTCWQNGNTVTIQWDNTKIVNGTIVNILMLYDDPSGIDDVSPDVNIIASKNWQTIASNVPNTGSYELDASSFGGNGNAYKLLIISDRGEWGLSKGLFSLNNCNDITDYSSTGSLLAYYDFENLFENSFIAEENIILGWENTNNVILENGILRLVNNYDGDIKRYVLLNINTESFSKLIIEKRTKIVPKDEFFMGSTTIKDSNGNIIYIMYNNYHYNNGDLAHTINVKNSEHFYIFNRWNYIDPDNFEYKISELINPIWNEWFYETIVIDYNLKKVEYSISKDGFSYFTISLSDVILMNDKKTQLILSTWDWASGSEHWIDYLKIFKF